MVLRLALPVSLAVSACTAAPPPDAADGALIVYSAPRVTAYAQSEYPVHSAYWLSGERGPARRIANLAGSFYQEPQRVPLAAGRYCVRGSGANGAVGVAVQVAAGHTTVLDLARPPPARC